MGFTVTLRVFAARYPPVAAIISLYDVFSIFLIVQSEKGIKHKTIQNERWNRDKIYQKSPKTGTFLLIIGFDGYNCFLCVDKKFKAFRLVCLSDIRQ